MRAREPLPPQMPEAPIAVSAASTYSAWLALHPKDRRTLEEYAANPIYHYEGAEIDPEE